MKKQDAILLIPFASLLFSCSLDRSSSSLQSVDSSKAFSSTDEVSPSESVSEASSIPIVNGGFELGSYEGWSNSGAAFNDALDVSSGTNKNLFIEGNFYLNGEYNGLQSTGYLISSPFTLEGTPYVNFKLGGAANKSKCYVALTDVEGNEIAAISNESFDSSHPSYALHRLSLKAPSKYLGKEVRLKLIDNDDSDTPYGALLFDDLQLGYAEKEEGSMLADANRYEERNKPASYGIYRPTYHFAPSIGWMNDPNGFHFSSRGAELFYQHYPFNPSWVSMYWGHAHSKDLIKWEDDPIALAPDESYDNEGVFSGGAIDEEGKTTLLYTCVSSGKQQQAIATSEDNIHFSKASKNPVISSALVPDNGLVSDFRDPCFIKEGDDYYALIGNKLKTSGGQLLLYKASSALGPYSYVGTVYQSEVTGGGLFECPDYETIDGQGVLITSPQFLSSSKLGYYQNIHSCTYQLGTLDFANGSFEGESKDELVEFDKGFDFYAATASKDDKGRTIMVAWMNMWSRNYPSAVEGYAGSLTLPRALSYHDGHVYQSPIEEIENYRVNEQKLDDFALDGSSKDVPSFKGKTKEISFELDVSKMLSGKSGIRFYEGDGYYMELGYDKEMGLLYLDRSNMPISLNGGNSASGSDGIRYSEILDPSKPIKIRMFLDNSSAEIFVNDGYFTLTSTCYPKEGQDGVSFFGNAGFASLLSYDLEVS